jgi:hypothetical protein
LKECALNRRGFLKRLAAAVVAAQIPGMGETAQVEAALVPVYRSAPYTLGFKVTREMLEDSIYPGDLLVRTLAGRLAKAKGFDQPIVGVASHWNFESETLEVLVTH